MATTRPQSGGVTEFIDGIQDEDRREDCRSLLGVMRGITGEEPQLWGSSMVGFGTYHYRYASGREGDYFKVGFAPRNANLTLYLMSGMVGRSHQRGLRRGRRRAEDVGDAAARWLSRM